MIKCWRHDGVNYLQSLLTSPRPGAVTRLLSSRLGMMMRREPKQLGDWVETGEPSWTSDVARHLDFMQCAITKSATEWQILL